VIPGVDGARKVHWSASGRGKRSGARVIYFHLDADRLCLVAVYAKADRSNMMRTRSERCVEMDIEKIARAIESDAGGPVEGLCDSLEEMPRQEFVSEMIPELIDMPTATLRDWEQGRFNPPGSALVLCRIVLKNPEALLSVV